MARFHPALVLIWLRTVAAQVAPPTNVTLHCRNLHNVVEWSYIEPPPGLQFRVYTGSQSNPPRILWVEPPTQQAEVLVLSDPREIYFLSVTAVVGENKSESAPPGGITFTYYRQSPAKQQCFLDFPSVNVTAQEDGNVLVRFVHPWLLYHHKMSSSTNSNSRKKKSQDAQIGKQLPELEYNVVIINESKTRETLTCEESVCETELKVDPTQERYCLTITGVMEKMSVQGTQEYCAEPLQISPHEHKDFAYIYIIVASLLIALAVVLLIVYRKKTRPSTSYPASMTITSRLKQWTLGVVQEPVSLPEVGPVSPTPLLTPTEEKEGKEFLPAGNSSTEPESRLPLGTASMDESVCDAAEEENEEEKGEASGYMKGGNLEDDENSGISEAPSGYEKRQVFLAPDELAEGYCARTHETEDSGSLNV